MGDSGGLAIKRTDVPGATRLTLTGVIDADLDRKPLLSARGAVILDLSGVNRITSYGVREWIRTLGQCEATYIGYIGCRPSVVAQFNMVAGFACRGEVVSMYLPYVCESCNRPTEHLLDLRAKWEVASKGTVPKVICESCGAQAEFDDIPDMYFAYVASQSRPNLPAVAEQLLAGETTGFTEKFRVKKEVHDRITGLWLTGALDPKVRFHRLVDGLEGVIVVVAAGVTRLDADLQHLIALTDLPGVELYFARMPMFIVNALSAAQRERLAGRVISACIPTECMRCHATRTIEVDATTVSPGSVHLCPSCRATLLDVVDGEAAIGLPKLLGTRVPQDLVEYLRARPGASPRDEEETTSPGLPSLLPLPMPSPQPDRVAGKYQILTRIGLGGMAEVFLAKQHGAQGFEKRVVLKRILPMLAASDTFIEMFLTEARLAAQISHPNVVQIFDLCSDGNEHFIAMEYVAGWDLRTLIKTSVALRRPFPVPFACRVASDICSGLHAAHTVTTEQGVMCGVVHRDVSPHNVLVSAQGAVKVSDFGVAKAFSSAGGEGVGTSPGVIKGKLPYMAPEQIDRKRGAIGPHTDTFATGLVLYEMVTGIAPFRRDEEAAAMLAVIDGVVPPVTREDVPDSLRSVLDRALARDIADRYASAAEMQHDLERVIMELRVPITQREMVAWLAEFAAAAVECGEWLPADKTPTGIPARRQNRAPMGTWSHKD